jgi:hypothetical protein
MSNSLFSLYPNDPAQAVCDFIEFLDTAIFERLNLVLTNASQATTGGLVVELAERTMPIWRNKRGFSGNNRQARPGIADNQPQDGET